MRAESLPTRRGAYSAGATALMTLVAIAATVSAAPPAAQIGCTAVMMEQSGVRGVAAVVAAAAREFFAGEKDAVAATYVEPQAAAPSRTMVIKPVVAAPAPPPLLGEHLLNIPPPAC